MFKVGDKVRVRKDLIVGNRYDGYIFCKEAEHYKNHEYEIVSIEGDNSYFLNTLDRFIFTDSMLENNQISEHKIQNDIRVALSENGCTVFRTNTGKVKMADGRWFDTGLPRGFSDLCGFRHSDGKMFFIEVKNQIGKRRQDQVKFANFVSQYPVLYGVARSVEDALEIVAL